MMDAVQIVRHNIIGRVYKRLVQVHQQNQPSIFQQSNGVGFAQFLGQFVWYF